VQQARSFISQKEVAYMMWYNLYNLKETLMMHFLWFTIHLGVIKNNI